MTQSGLPDTPLVTVLLPCYNAEQFLPAALDSLLGQTYANIEILAIDDGSRDSTARILSDYASRDARIRLAPNDTNYGLVRTLNRGMSLANGSLVARMDSDDVAVPTRIEEQVRYFSMRPDTDMLASDVSYIRTDGRLLYNPRPYRFSSRTLRFLMFFLNPMCHPTVMGRRDVFLKHPYSEHAQHSEDFELWHRMLGADVVFRILPKRLLRFRPNSGSVSTKNAQEQVAMYLRTSADAILHYFGIQLSSDVHRILIARMTHGNVRSADLEQALELFADMRAQYVRREKLTRADELLIGRFSNRQLANIYHQSYRRSSREDPARALAARKTFLMTLRSPLSVCSLALERARERARR